MPHHRSSEIFGHGLETKFGTAFVDVCSVFDGFRVVDPGRPVRMRVTTRRETHPVLTLIQTNTPRYRTASTGRAVRGPKKPRRRFERFSCSFVLFRGYGSGV